METRQIERHPATGRANRPACLVAGCPCRADGIVSTSRAAVRAVKATIGETVGRSRLPESSWRFVGLPVA